MITTPLYVYLYKIICKHFWQASKSQFRPAELWMKISKRVFFFNNWPNHALKFHPHSVSLRFETSIIDNTTWSGWIIHTVILCYINVYELSFRMICYDEPSCPCTSFLSCLLVCWLVCNNMLPFSCIFDQLFPLIKLH